MNSNDICIFLVGVMVGMIVWYVATNYFIKNTIIGVYGKPYICAEIVDE